MQTWAGSTGNVRVFSLVHHKKRSQIALWNHFSSRHWNNEGIAAKGRVALPVQHCETLDRGVSGPAELLFFFLHIVLSKLLQE